MSQLAASPIIEMRKHPRSQLRMPARIRSSSPLGMRIEITRTIDASRAGVRIPRSEAREWFVSKLSWCRRVLRHDQIRLPDGAEC
jgi:hypothetical protein